MIHDYFLTRLIDCNSSMMKLTWRDGSDTITFDGTMSEIDLSGQKLTAMDVKFIAGLLPNCS